ncbi:MAG: recombinase family protein [Chloroflexi bacterium]|nr:recombinase family protein [Chloroflexota bacterium]
MKTVIYVRVSDPGAGQTTENQRPILEAWAKERGLELVGVYEEGESAWRAGHQHELAHLVRDARSRRFQVVLCWSLDRLSRLGPTATLMLVRTLGTYGVKVLSHQEPWIETSSPAMTEFLMSLCAWVATQESERRSERTKAGLARLKAAGRKLGRPLGATDKKKRQKRIARIHAQYLTPEGVW